MVASSCAERVFALGQDRRGDLKLDAASRRCAGAEQAVDQPGPVPIDLPEINAGVDQADLVRIQCATSEVSD